MRKIRLDVDQLAVTSFETDTSQGGVHSAAAITNPVPQPVMPTNSCQTNEYACLATTKLAEDCFGPTAGCPLNTADECPYCTADYDLAYHAA